MKLIIVANRLPVRIVEENGELRAVRSEGGLATGLKSLRSGRETHWIGWHGYAGEKTERVRGIIADDKIHPVDLPPELIADFYEGFCNDTLWPLCHYFYIYVKQNKRYWEAYRECNRLFCEAVLGIAGNDDLIWVHDYQLMLLPGMLRQRLPAASIGYFHHIPFPSYELFRILPERKELLSGLLGADLVGFHTHDYMRHFISSVYRVLGLECRMDEIVYRNRIIEIDAFPMGIDFRLYHRTCSRPEVAERAELLKKTMPADKIILSVDRLDYTKGLLNRLKAFSGFLDRYPQYQGQVSLIMIVSPSRNNVETYAELKTSIDTVVGEINGRFSSVAWIPVYYFYQSHSMEELCALYHISDIALITPLRDGMNLVAKEFVAAKQDRPGVLILSETAGAASQLKEALVVNPNDPDEVIEVLDRAMRMPRSEQRRRIASMQRRILRNDVVRWANDFFTALSKATRTNRNRRRKELSEKDSDHLVRRFQASARRLFLLDYDGTLVPLRNDPKEARPSAALSGLLRKLASDPRNKVVIISGRDSRTLEKWLGKLPVDLVAEHGAAKRCDGRWSELHGKVKWSREITSILDRITRMTPGSWLEKKNTALVWHYRETDAWLADLRLNQLLNELTGPVSHEGYQIMKGNKIVEIKSLLATKGAAANEILGRTNYDFVLALGDDTTDEEMFSALPETVFTVKVGPVSDYARFSLDDSTAVTGLLEKLAIADTVPTRE